MKKVSRIIALSLAIMLLSGVAVFASEAITGVDPAQQTVAFDTDITITATAPVAVDQVTVIVYKGASPTEANIAYIDQKANTSGTVAFTFKMRDAMEDGIYTVKVGGTDVATADSSATVDLATATKFTISGIVTPFIPLGTLGDPAEDAKIAVTATLKDSEGAVVDTKIADKANGTYSFADVAEGVYTVVLTRLAALSKLPIPADTATAVDGVVDVGTSELYIYDVAEDAEGVHDNYVDGADFFAVFPQFDTYPGDGIYNPMYDVTMDGYVDGADFFAVFPYFDYYGDMD